MFIMFETIITFGWKVALEENALGLLFQSILKACPILWELDLNLPKFSWSPQVWVGDH
jgi:hypothetical protein